MRRVVDLFLVLCLLAGPAEAADLRPPCVHLQASPGATAAYWTGIGLFYSGRAGSAESAFRDAVRAVPDCALLHSWLSRCLLQEGRADQASIEQSRADALMNETDDREQRIVYAWHWHLQGLKSVKALERERSILDYAIAVYPDDEELWALRGDAAESALRAAPYRLFLLKVDPHHPLSAVWKSPLPAAPVINEGNKTARLKASEVPRLFDGLGNLHHSITTRNALAQKYYDQGLRCFHSYVTPVNIPNSAGQCFRYALGLDPSCAMAWWGLSFCVPQTDAALQLAHTAARFASQGGTDKERRFCAARVMELLGPGLRQSFLDTLDGAICAYPEDVELWIWRGKVYGDYGAGPEDEAPSIRVLAGMAFELAAVRMHPEHPSPNHELIHDYEAIDRPALGWKYTLAFRQSAPNMPHANHMQAHLAMRLGRWDDALEATRMAFKLSQEGYPELDPGHHLYVRLLALAHEGCFNEIMKTTAGARDNLCWARMLRLMADDRGLRQWARDHVANPTPDNVYMAALVDLDLGDAKDAGLLIDKLQPLVKQKQYNAYNYIEARARWLIATGRAEEGFKLFRDTAARAVEDANLHFFGGGGYFPEVWGEEALKAGRLSDAAQAFSEALAHDHGSIVGALGMQVVWERQGHPDMAAVYSQRAADMWKHADAGAAQRLLNRLRGLRGKP